MTTDNFPPIISHLGTQLGKKNELTLVIPKTSKLYYIFTKEENLYNLQSNQFVSDLSSMMAYEDIEEHIIHTQTNENSIVVTLNIEHIKHQTIRIAEDYNPKNPFVFDYTIGHGYVINIEMTTIRYTDGDIMELFEETKHIAKKCHDALITIGYKSPFYKSSYKNDKNVARIWVLAKRVSCTLTISLFEKDVYKNYHKIEKIMKAKNIEKHYQILNTILK